MCKRSKAVLLVTLLCAPSVLADEASWSVMLTELGDQKISVIKIVREHTSLGLKDAKDLVEAPKPKLIKEGLTKNEADALVAELAAKGAKAEAHQKGQRESGESGHPRKEQVAAEQPGFEVKLESFGESKIMVIKVVREHTGLGLAETKKLVESAPVVLKEFAPREAAQKLASELTAVGAKVTLSPKKP